MIFELYVPELDIALGGGGRYDRLIEAFGGEPTPAVGMAAGIDRIGVGNRSPENTVKKATTEKGHGSRHQRRTERRSTQNRPDASR